MAKIMQINITCGRGSTGDIAARLYYASEREGYEARFAYASFEPTIPSAFRIENKLQHYLRRGLNKYIGKKQMHSTPGTKRLIRYIKREKPDLIHVHNVQQNSVNYKVLFDFLKKSGIPIVFTLHDCWSFTGGCYHFFKRGCEKYTDGCRGECVVDRDDITRTVEKAYAYKKDSIGGNGNIRPVCVSEWLRSVAARSYMGSMKHPPTVIHNGIDTGVFYPRVTDIRKRLNISDGCFVVLGVASYWNNDKGLHYFEKLSEQLSGDVKIILVGRGLEEAQERNNNFICISSTESREELAEVYSCADVFANLSLEETFGLTTAEALACGTPAIVFNTTASPEVIDGNTGESVCYQNDEQKDLKSIITAIENIKKNKKCSYTEACVARIKEHFTTEKMAESYISLYRSILGECDEYS